VTPESHVTNPSAAHIVYIADGQWHHFSQ
jgi:hypothetical protein